MAHWRCSERFQKSCHQTVSLEWLARTGRIQASIHRFYNRIFTRAPLQVRDRTGFPEGCLQATLCTQEAWRCRSLQSWLCFTGSVECSRFWGHGVKPSCCECGRAQLQVGRTNPAQFLGLTYVLVRGPLSLFDADLLLAWSLSWLTLLTIVHDNTDLILLDERVMILNNEGVVQGL